MHPPTPHPASARTKSRMHDTAFREITSRTNAVSKSEQDFASVLKKAEEAAGKLSKTPNASRRYSVASKFAGPKADSTTAHSGDIAPGGAKSKVNKQAFTCVPQSNGAFGQASLPAGRNAEAPSKALTHKPAVPSLQATKLGSLPRKQPLVPEQAIKLQKPTFDSRSKTVSAHAKAESAHSSKPKGMLLKSARYWLEQVKLAEVMGKHGVSAGFFCLAVECEAEPVELLREELISYIMRHSLWSNSIRQVLLSYGVTNEAQHILFPELSINDIVETSIPCTPACKLEAILSTDIDPAGQVPEKGTKYSGANFDSSMPKDTVEESNIKKEALQSQKILVPDALGDIESMDADTVTRKVVSYIMSSMNHPDSLENQKNCARAAPKDSSMHANSDQNNNSRDSLENLKNCALAGPKDRFMHANSDQNTHSSKPLLEAESSVLGTRRSEATPKSRDSKEAVPQGSPPSLGTWNTLSKEVSSANLDVQEEVSITLDNGISESASTEKETGEEMCVSMELDVDETVSDNVSDLQSKSPTYQSASSEKRNCHKAQKTDETQDNVAKASDVIRSRDEAVSAFQKCEESSEDLIYRESHDKVFEAVQVTEKIETSSHEGLKLENVNVKAETEKSTETEMNCLLESEGNIKSSSSCGARSQNGKEKSAPKKAEAPVPPKKYNGAASTLQNSRRLSTSTPKSATSVCVSKAETGSRKGRKSRLSQLSEQGIDNNLMTPNQEVRDGSRQVFLNILEGMDGAMGSMATPGSAGVRRSARLMRPSGGTTISTPGSVSTRVQRKLGTPMKAELDEV